MATRQPKAPAAFLSYAHLDDEASGGQITRLRERLALDVSVALGERFEIFQDRDGIGWGQHWPKRIDEALGHALFLIAVLTPSYFKSQPCRSELEKFLDLEGRAGRGDLILPIYFRTARPFEDKTDPLAARVKERQYRDWRELRQKPIDAPEVRQALEQLADEIEAAVHRTLPAADGAGEYVARASRQAVVVTQGDPVARDDVLRQWLQVRGLLQAEVGETAFSTWLQPLDLAHLGDDRVILHVPTRFLRDWIAAHYADRILALWRSINPEIRAIVIDARLPPDVPAADAAVVTAVPSEDAGQQSAPPPADRPVDLEPIEEERRVARTVALRAAPALAARTVTRLKAGMVVYVAGRARGSSWLFVEEDSELRGYVVEDAVEPLGPSTTVQATTTIRPEPRPGELFRDLDAPQRLRLRASLGNFGEFIQALPKSSTDVDKLLAAGFFAQSRSGDNTFSTGDANNLLIEQGIKLGNPSQCVKQNLNARRVFQLQRGRYRVSQPGVDYLRQLFGGASAR